MKSAPCEYELLDFGDGRKLERFAGVVLSRPCPAAEGVARSRRGLWDNITARFRGPRVGDGSWSPRPGAWVPAGWHLAHSGDAGPHGRWTVRLGLDAMPSGQVGVFPEQRPHWDWIARQVSRSQAALGRPPRVLNLFAYTGGSTLAAAAAGAHVVHIDSAANLVARARDNAALSELADRPIRWIAEDALKFCRRELKRGNQYDGVILDPPTYGHGPKGEVWHIGRDLLPLLEQVGQLTLQSRQFLLASCHTPGIGPAELAASLADGVFGHCGAPPAAGELCLQRATGERLPSGTYARWPR